MTTLLSIDVWRDSAEAAAVLVFQGERLVETVIVVSGDVFDLELQDGVVARLEVAPPPPDSLSLLEAS